MAFKTNPAEFKLIDVTLIDPDPQHPRKFFDETYLQALANSVREKGVIQPVIVRPANAQGRYTLVVGERRWRAAVLADEKTLPALIRDCDDAEALEVRIFENMGQGVRIPLETREMANAIQAVATRLESREAAAERLGRSASWVAQSTAAANLSPKVTALLDSGQISSCATAIQLEKLVQKDEGKADVLISQLNEGERLPKKAVDSALSAVSGRRKKKAEAEEGAAEATGAAVPSDAMEGSSGSVPSVSAATAQMAHAAVAPSPRVNPNKMKMVAEILGLDDGDEEEVLARLIDEFLALKSSANPPF